MMTDIKVRISHAIQIALLTLIAFMVIPDPVEPEKPLSPVINCFTNSTIDGQPIYHRTPCPINLGK